MQNDKNSFYKQEEHYFESVTYKQVNSKQLNYKAL